MPQPNRPLPNIFVSSRSDRLRTPTQVITPRTPHSRNGRAEEGFTDVELDELPEFDEEEEDPLLTAQPPPSVSPGPASTAFPPTGYRSRGDDHETLGPKLRMCPSALMIAERLVYLSAAFFVFGIFALFIMAFRRDMEDDALGRVISYRHHYVFPLTGAQYAHECEKISWFKQGPDYWDAPLNGPLDTVHHDRRLKLHGHSHVCPSTVTYQLDGHVDLATDLALMAQVAALARERNSTFFVEDTYWNHGRWVDYFEDVAKLYPGPAPGCRRPPPKELVACPRSARHWVVNSHTAKYHLNSQFAEMYEDRTAQGVSRRRLIYDLATQSLMDIIRPDTHMSALIRAARSEIASILSLPYEGHTQYEPYIGLQLVHSHSTLFPNASTSSLAEYVQAVKDTWSRLYPHTPIPPTAPADASGSGHFPAPPMAYVAADSPEELRSYVAAFPPATAKFALDLSTNAELRALAPEHTYDLTHFMNVPIGERVGLTRGMIVDLALMSGLWAEDGYVIPGATICAAGSNACELAAVGLGWERAFGFDGSAQQVASDIDHARRRWVPLGAQNADWRGFELPVHRDIIQ